MNQDSGHLPPAVQNALEELQSYLSDQIPPLFFVGSLQELFAVAPEIVVAQVVGWATRQFSPGGALPTADYLFHAAKKIHLIAELGLVSREAIGEFLELLRPGLLAACPADDRADLTADLDRMGLEVGVGAVGGVDVVYRRSTPPEELKARQRAESRQSVVADPDLALMSRSFVQGLGKLDLLLRNLGLGAAPGGAPPAPRSDASAEKLKGEVISQAATWVRSSEEMEKLLEELGKRGIEVAPERLLRMLVERLPDWAPPPAGVAEGQDAPQAAVRAMARYVSMAPDKTERNRRYSELVDTAVEEFNGGSLGRAVTLLDLAVGMTEKEEVDTIFADSVQRQAHGKLDAKRLQKLAEEKEHHQLLRRLLGFFRMLSPKELLAKLDGEPDRNKRKYLLDLLRAHQSDARQVVYSELADAHTGARSFHWHYMRNLVHLLRTIPRDSGVPVENEIDVLVPLTGLENELPVIREALATFGQLSHERAVTTLAARINEVEEILLSDQQHSLTADQLISLLDSMVKSLAKLATPAARRYVVVHALKRNPKLGDTLERMTWLSDQDLSSERDIVVRLIAETRNELPRGILGLSRKSSKKQQALDALVRTLAGTSKPEVIQLLTEVRDKHSDLPAAATAAEILLRRQDRSAGTEEETPTLSGDLALFGLPNLLQNLADSQIGGLLRILGPGGGTTARVWMKDGLVLAAEAGKLRAEVAVYELLEDPAPGQFVFGDSNDQPGADAMTKAPMSVQSVLFEGIRRYDEFKHAAAVVPDGAIFNPTGAKPTPAEGETDGDLVREVWRRASSGFSPVDCEAEIAVDRYRVRRLYEHWLTEGSLAFSEASGQGA